MAKKQNKLVKEETLETILFNCRNSLRGRAAMTDKRDLLLTLVFQNLYNSIESDSHAGRRCENQFVQNVSSVRKKTPSCIY